MRSLVRWLLYVREGTAGNLAMIGRTQRTLKRTSSTRSSSGSARSGASTRRAPAIILFGRRNYVAGADNEAAVTKIQGLTLAGAYVQEVTIPESFWSPHPALDRRGAGVRDNEYG